MVAIVIISSSELYLRQLTERYECTQAEKAQYSFDDQLAQFIFKFDEDSSRLLREVSLYHAWYHQLDNASKTSYIVRVPTGVHKYCKVHAVAARFKDPLSFVRFRLDMETDQRNLSGRGIYHCWELLPQDEEYDAKALNNQDCWSPESGRTIEEHPVMIASTKIAEKYNWKRLDLYASMSCVFTV